MAKAKAKRRVRAAFARARNRFKHKRTHSGGGVGGDLGMTILGAGLYGAVRERVSIYLAPYTSKIPAGALADELGMAVIDYLLAKGKIPLLNKMPMLRQIGKAGLTIEAARVGEYVAREGISGAMGGGSSSGYTF